MVNEDFEDVFDAALATQVAFQQPAEDSDQCTNNMNECIQQEIWALAGA